MLTLIYFSVAWVLIVYLFNSLVARSFKKISIETAALYISTVALIGVFGEVFSDTLYNAVFGIPLWQYQVFPVHGGYTSYYSLFVWGMYGFYLYLLHDSLNGWHIESTRKLAAIISIEAIVLEFIFNGTFLLVFGSYFFYYLPNDLWHLTTVQAIPFYFLAGIAITKTIKQFKSAPLFFILMNVLLASVFIFFV